MRKLVFIVGTRPEAIKLSPVVIEARMRGIESVIVDTGQHKDMVEPALQAFSLEPDYKLYAEADSTIDGYLPSLTSALFIKIGEFITQITDPTSVVVVQGDTTSALVGALCGRYHGLKVAHVEAGLRSGDDLNPFPEEINRKLIAQAATYHFCPTSAALQNLINEGIDPLSTAVVGNTVVDALYRTLDRNYYIDDDRIRKFLEKPNSKLILLTMHRRESWLMLKDIFTHIKSAVEGYEDVLVVVPMHPNVVVKQQALEIFDVASNFHLVDALDYTAFINLLAKCYFVVTDSGGIQEEAPYLLKPSLVIRKVTERTEGVTCKVSLVTGMNPVRVSSYVKKLLHDDEFYNSMRDPSFNAYGDGEASLRIIDCLKEAVETCQS